MTQNNNTTLATINIDALLAAGVINPSAARKLAAKIEWYKEEQDMLDLHQHGSPQKRLVELEDETMYLHYAANACKQALLELNKFYKQATGRYIVIGMIQNHDNLVDLIDQVLAM